MNKGCLTWLLICIPLMLAGCSHKAYHPKTAYFTPVAYTELNGWEHDHHLKALEAFKRSCSVILKYKPGRRISMATHIGGEAANWQPICHEAAKNSIFTNLQAKHFFEKWFSPYLIKDAKGSDHGKFTGYYEIELKGSRKRSKVYKYPVYRSPSNLNQLKGRAGITHAAINKGVLANKRLEIAWVSNKARLFFMQIQGSGVIKLAEGGEMKLGFCGQNGYGYCNYKYWLLKMHSPA